MTLDDHDFEPRHAASPTDAIMTAMALYQPAPPEGEADERPMPDDAQLTGAVSDILDALASTLRGTPLERDLDELLWGAVNLFHRAATRHDQRIDDLIGKIKQSQCEQDGSEIASLELERLIVQAHSHGEARDTLETMRDQATIFFRHLTGSPWAPRSRSLTQHRTLTAAMIDARDFIEARKRAQTQMLIPAGTRIVVTGGMEYQDHDLIWDVLDKVHAKHGDMVLLHGGTPKGVELIAGTWARARNVTQIVYKPDWAGHAKAAPFRRNDLLLEALPAGVIIFPGSGVSENLADKARKLGIPVMRPVPKG